MTILDICNMGLLPKLGFIYILILNDAWRIPREKVILVLGGFFIVTSILDAGALWLFGIGMVGKLSIAAIELGLAITIILYLSEYRNGRMVFILFTAINMDMVSSIYGELIGKPYTVVRMIGKVIIHLLMLILVYQYFRKPFKTMLEGLQKDWLKITFISAVLSILQMLVLISNMMGDRAVYRLIGGFICIVVFCFYAAAYYIFRALQDQHKINEDNALLRTQMIYLCREVETAQEIQEKMKVFRHDMRHYLRLQMAGIENGEIENVKEIVMSMGERLNDIRSDAYPNIRTGQALIDLILSYYAKSAEESGVDMKIRLIFPEELEVDAVEWAIVVANCVENALNACMTAPKEIMKKIRVIGKKRQSQFFFEISNTCRKKPMIDPVSRLPATDQPGHGYGMKSVKTFCDQNDVAVSCQAEGGWFNLMFLFNLKEPVASK